MLRKHLAEEIDRTESRSLGTNQRTAVGHALTRQYARILEGELTVHAVEVADLACTYADITGRDIRFGADVTPQLGHKGLAEAHHLAVRLPLGVEVRTTLGTTHREGRQGILEDLLKAEELENRGIYRGVETQTALVGADCVVELHTVARIDLHLTAVIDPRHLEGELTIRLHDALGNFVGLKFGMLVVGLLHGGQHLADSLQILALARMTTLEFCHKFRYVHSYEVLGNKVDNA